MDRLHEQMRARYSNSEKKDGRSKSTGEGNKLPNKSVSFKEEKKVNWFQRLSSDSGKMRQVDDPSDDMFATAVAAATYAISSLEEGSLNKKMSGYGSQSTLTKTKSRRENSGLKTTDSGRISRWFSGKEPKEDGGSVATGETSMRKSETRDGKALEDPRKGVVTVPSIKKTPTFGASLGTPSSRTRTPSSRTSGKLNSYSSHTDTKADAWEKAEMAKIQRRYEKTCSSILEWENAKKGKAKNRFEQKEREIERRRTKALRDYNDEIGRIKNIVSGARAVADEKRRNDEFKTKEKANVIRSTGKTPGVFTCF